MAWQKAQDLAVEVYMTFKSVNDFDFRSQVRSAAISVPKALIREVRRIS
ncbi:MAG: four helix bundle protein [Chitinophagaceae bacterium]|nr:four helix bundle protein [Chitinophagaceae bacterium]